MNDTITNRPNKVSQEIIDKYRRVTPPDLSKIDESVDIRVKERGPLSTGLTEYSGSWDRSSALHLLRRTMFGVKKSDLDQLENLTFNDAIQTILSESAAPGPPVNDYNNDPHVAFGETWIESPHSGDFEGERIASLKTWMIRNMVDQETNITEKLVLFWHNLLVTQSWEIFTGRLSYQYFKILRDHAFGNFKDLVKAITIDPAMLLYLNGAWNVKESPDENYARELQELFCIGKGENANFTEADVQAAARVLTGWSIDWSIWESNGIVQPVFNDWAHDTSNKQFSSFYGDRTITGKFGPAGVQELDDMLDMIFDNNEVAMFICRRLYNFFVYNETDESTELNVITPLAQIFRENDYEIRPVLEALFSSEHFFDEANHGVLIKNPSEHLIGTWRSLNMSYEDPDDIYKVSRTNLAMYWRLNGMGMEIADPPSVAGWPSYYQAPQFDRSWITTDTITKRAENIDQMLYGWFWTADERFLKADLMAFIDQFDNPELPGPMIEAASEILLGIKLEPEAIDRLKATLLTGQPNESYWTGAWQDYKSDPTNEDFKGIVEVRLQLTFQAMQQLGEFQLM